MKKSIVLIVMSLLALTLYVPVQAGAIPSERVTYLAEDITNAQELIVRAERGIDERSERLKESGKIVARTSGQLADGAEVRHTTQLLKRAELGDGKIEETYQTTAVVKSRSGSKGNDNFAAYVKIYWRVESDSTLPIDEYYFVRSEHWFAINGSYSATQLNAWNVARIHSAWEDRNDTTYSNPTPNKKYTLSSPTSDVITADGKITGVTEVSSNYGTIKAEVSYVPYQ